MPSLKAPAAAARRTATTLTVWFPGALRIAMALGFFFLFSNELNPVFCIWHQVAAKCRPIARRDYGRDIIRVSDGKVSK